MAVVPHPGGPRLRPDVLVERVGGGVLILDPGTGTVHHLNDAAAAVLDLCDGSSEVDDIIAALRDRYVVPVPDRLDRDVRHVVDQLDGLGLLVQGDPW